MSEQNTNGSDLLFAWLTPIEANVDKKLHRPRSPNLSSPLLRAKTAIRRTFSAGQRAQRQRQQVKEALEALWWLREAGFPQYVQLFEDGHFPLNISRFHVEKDHSFLNTTELETLIRRLNILNRSTPHMEEIMAGRREGGGEVERALSDRWVYRHKWQHWARNTRHRCHSDGSEGGNLADTSLPSPSNPTMVSELRGSLTDLTREVKTYSFCPTEDGELPPIVVDPPDTTHYASTSSSSPTKPLFPRSSPPLPLDGDMGEGEGGGVRLSGLSIDSEEDSEIFDPKLAHFDEGESFASGLYSAFDHSMRKLRTAEHRSHSLPDVFTLDHDIIDTSCVSTTTDENTSTSVSVASMQGDSAASGLNEPFIERVVTPDRLARSTAPYVNGHDDRGHQKPVYVRTSSANTLPSSFKAGNVGAFSTEPPPSGRTAIPKRWSGPASDIRYGYESGSDIGELDREPRARLSPLADGGWMSRSYAHPQRRRSPDSPAGEEAESAGVRRRKKRDSGGSSHRRSKAHWHSFQKRQCFPQLLKTVRTLVPIEELSAGQVSVLQRLALVKLTAMLELYGSSVNIVRCLRRKHKLPDVKGRRVFGSTLSENVRRYGNPIPPTILCAIQHLHDNGLETVGVFRRAAGKSRLGVLRGLMETNPAYCNFEGYSVCDVADLVKQFFRELPEPLLTVRLSEILTAIQDVIPKPLQVEMVRCVMLLLPCENRCALLHLLSLLGAVAQRTAINQMDAKNLALCFSPSLFSLSSSPYSKLYGSPSNPFPRVSSLKRHTLNSSPSPLSLSSTKEVTETVTSSQSLQLMITHRKDIFQVAADQLQVVKFSYLELSVPVPYQELVNNEQYGIGTNQSFLDSCITTILKESRRRFKEWVRCDDVKCEGGEGVEVSYMIPGDGVPLWVWRGTTDIPASPKAIFERLWHYRHVWDKTLVSSWRVATIDPQTEVFQYVTRSSPPHCDRDHCLLRAWHRDVPTGRYVVASTSVSHPLAELRAGVRVVHLASHFLLTPATHSGGGTQVTAICREDWRGHSIEYYNRSLGPHLVSSTLTMLRNSFREIDFMETPV